MTEPTATRQQDQAIPAVEITRVIKAPRDKVFAAFTVPEELRKWWGPEGTTTPSAEIDLQAGGSYRFEMRSPEGETHGLTGVFREVVAPERLVFTWIWEEGEIAGHESLVTLSFRDLGAATEVRLRHEFLPSELARQRHGEGWGGCFTCLERLFEEGQIR